MNTYSIIPTLILEDPNTSSQSKILYAFLNSFSTRWGYTIITNEELAQKMATSSRTIQRYLRELSERGYIKIEIKGEKRKIWPNMSFKPEKFRNNNCGFEEL